MKTCHKQNFDIVVVSVAEQACLIMTWSETLKRVHDKAQIYSCFIKYNSQRVSLFKSAQGRKLKQKTKKRNTKSNRVDNSNRYNI